VIKEGVMVSAKPILRIIRQQPGDLTGETLHQTEDGRWWQSVQFKTPHRTGERTGIKVNGYIRRE